MKNLIKEIEKLRDSVKDIPSIYAEGGTDAINECLNIINQYNLITAPKSIKLSEIMNKLNLAFPKIAREEKVIRIYNGKALILNIFDNHLQPINVQPYSETKWLYTLWIANVEIVDDLEGDDNE